MITVRPASPEDIPWLLAQLRQFDTFYGAAMFKSAEAAEAKLVLLLEKCVFLVAEDVRGPIGFIAGFVWPDFLTDEIRLNELFWWVAEDARHGRAGLLLLAEFRAYGREHGAVRTVLSRLPLTPLKPDTLARLGFTEGETSWWEWTNREAAA